MNLIDQNITFEEISSEYPELGSVISSSIGLPTPEKVAQVLQSYEKPNQILIGGFLSKNLIAVIGFELIDTKAEIRHISVLNNFQKQGIAKLLVQAVIKNYILSRVEAETDNESVGFYKSLGFTSEAFQGEYGIRYFCFLDLSL